MTGRTAGRTTGPTGTDRLRWVRPVLGLAAAVGLWWAVVAGFGIRPFLLPAPPDLVAAFVAHGPYLGQQALITLGHTLAGFALAAGAGLATAAVLAAVRWVRESVLPLLVAVQAVPKVAFAPLLIMWLGFGANTKIAMVALLCFFPIVLATLTGLTATPAELVELAHSLSASHWHTFWKFRLPYALPQVFTGLKVGVSLALIGAVVAQLTTPNAGLGAVIVRSGHAADTPLAFAAITLLALTGVGLFYLVTAAERLLLPWARATTA